MSITCAVCQSKQNFWTPDYPIPNAPPEQRMCHDCSLKMAKISHAVSVESVSAEMEFFRECINKNISSEAETYILSEIENLHKRLEEEEKVKADREEKTKKAQEQLRLDKEFRNNFMLTTGFSFEGFLIQKYTGIVSGQVVLGTGFLSEFSASFADFFGTESDEFAQKLEQAKKAAISKLVAKAIDAGGNAAIGVDFDYITFKNNMIGVVANGTSVVIEKCCE